MNTTNKMTIAALLAVASLTACQNGGENKDAGANKQAEPQAFTSGTGDGGAGAEGDTCTSCIPVDSANKMIGSYIASLNGNPNNQYLYSLIADANDLRNYLNANPSVTNLKLMFAHTLPYINGGGGNVYCGTKAGQLTLVIAGYDANGNYVIGTNGVMDNLQPCPINCPSIGTAASNTINVQ